MAPKKKVDQSEITVEVTPVSQWKRPSLPSLTLPSGNTVRARKAAFQSFIAAGIIPNSLMATVQKALSKGQEVDMSAMVDDPSKITEMLAMVDGVVMFCVVEPRIHAVPVKTNDAQEAEVDEEAREEDLLYIDEVDDEDKMFIFQWATGGTDDVETFRSESADSLADFQRGS